jgi:hypothetical protein
MKKIATKVFIMDIPIYNQDVIVVLGGDMIHAKKYFLKKSTKNRIINKEIYNNLLDYMSKCIKEDNIKDTTEGRLHIDVPRGYIMLIKNVNISVIAHEATHLTQYILENASIDPDKSIGYKETFAYLNGYIIGELYRYSKDML